MSLWGWVLEAYERPGVPQACLALQDEHGQNTSLLLWAAWAGTLDEPGLTMAASTARDWEKTAVGPLRAVRRALKAPSPPVADAARESLREAVKAAELQAERILMETLESLGLRGEASPAAAMAAATRAWGGRPPTAALRDLADALGDPRA
jgi:uncharacterized protein (TIGR02444 family)